MDSGRQFSALLNLYVKHEEGLITILWHRVSNQNIMRKLSEMRGKTPIASSRNRASSIPLMKQLLCIGLCT